MPTAALLCLALLANPSQDPAPWQYYRFGESGLKLLLPAAPKPNPDKPGHYTLEHEGLTLDVLAQPANDSQPLPETERYLATIEVYRKQYGKRITAILNESDVIAALRFGATASIGYSIEANGGAGASVGWHLVRIDGYDYEITVKGERRHRPWVLTVLDSQQYVNPKTGEFPTAPIGSLGIQSLLGTAFLSLTGAESDRATSLVLQGDNIPVVGVAQLWIPSNVDYSTPAAVTEAFVKQLTASNIAQNPLIKIEETTKDGQKIYTMVGEVFVTDRKVTCQGIAVIFEDRASSIILLFDPEDKTTAELAKKILESVKPVSK